MKPQKYLYTPQQTGIRLSPEQQAQFRWELKHSRNMQVYRRAAALLAVHGGQSVGQVAELLGVTRQSVYNWLVTYAQAKQAIDLADAPRVGRPSLWTKDLEAFLIETLEQKARSDQNESTKWTVALLQKGLASRRGRSVSAETLRRKLRQLGFVRKNGRYVLSME